MRSHFVACIAALVIFAAAATAQDIPEKADAEKQAETKAKAVALLRETMADVANLRTLENRISFTAEMAALMWYHDDREARLMFGYAVNDFKALLMQYDGQMNALGTPETEENVYSPFLTGDPSDRARIAAKFQMALGVRQQIAMSIAEHAPELAYNFFHDSSSSITNAQFRKQIDASDAMYEQQLIAQIARTDAEKAADLGKRSLAKGFSYQQVELLKLIYQNDADRGVDYGAAVLARLKEEKADKLELWSASSLLDFGNENLKASEKEGGKKAVYTRAELRDIAEAMARAILDRDSDEEDPGVQYVDAIEEYHPGRAAQIRSKFKIERSEPAGRSVELSTVRGATPPPPPARISNTAGVGSGSGVASGGPAGTDAEKSEQDEVMAEVASLGDKELPDEERARIVEKAREILAKTPGRDKKIMGLSMLAAQVRRAGDADLASEIMRDAEQLVNPQPKTYQDFLYTWILAAGYAEADPERAFPILEDAVFRANELISAFVRVAEFIDVGEQVVVEGEFQVGAFGGGMIRQMTAGLGMADGTLKTLVNADFDKTKAVASRFDRPEIRVLAKMMVLRSVLGEKSDDPAGAVNESEEGAN